MACVFPQEIVDDIIDHFQDDSSPESLRTCSLVARSWSHEADAASSGTSPSQAIIDSSVGARRSPGAGWDCFIHAYIEALRSLGEANGPDVATKEPRPFHIVQVTSKFGFSTSLISQLSTVTRSPKLLPPFRVRRIPPLLRRGVSDNEHPAPGIPVPQFATVGHRGFETTQKLDRHGCTHGG